MSRQQTKHLNGNGSATLSDAEIFETLDTSRFRVDREELAGPLARNLRRQEQIEEEKRDLLDKRSKKEAELEASPAADTRDRKLFPKIKIICAILAIPSLSCMAVMNAAGQVVDTTQSLPLAIFYVGVFGFAGFGLEAYASKLGSRQKVDIVMSCAFLACLLTFLGAFARIFAFEPEISAVEGLLSGKDHRLLFVTQILTEIALTYGFVSKIKGWLAELREMTPHPCVVALKQDIVGINTELKAIENEALQLVEEAARIRVKEDRINTFNTKFSRMFQD